MTSFPTGFGRAPTLLYSRMSLSNIERTSYDIFRVSQQLSTGRDLLKPSDDAVRASSVSMLDERIGRYDQILRNLELAGGSLDTIDQALGDAFDLVNEALSIASSQITSTASAEEREGQAVVVDQLVNALYRVGLRESLIGYVFGGTAPGRAPFEELGGAFRFVGERGSLTTDIGDGPGIPVTIGASNAIGALSTRIEGSRDLDPNLTLQTRLTDLNGARDLGITLGVVKFSFNGLPEAEVDLSGADTVGDVVDALTAAIGQYETDNGVTVLGPGGISVSDGSLTVDVPAGDLTFSDLQGGTTALDLGIAFDPSQPFNAGLTLGMDLDPKLSWTTPISQLGGLGGGGLGSILLKNNGKTSVVDLSGAQTLGDLKSLIESGGNYVRVEINDNGTGIDIVTEVAGGQTKALSISEVDDGLGNTAELLGVRSLFADTELSAFNDGRGVQVLSGATDPTTGLPAPEYDTDFRITLGDGFEIDINLAPDDVQTVQTLLDAINAQADAALTAAGRPVTDFEASLGPAENGIIFTQLAGTGNAIRVAPRNNSTAAEQLGLLDGTLDSTGDVLLGEDRATVRVDNLFTALIDLSESLRNDDTAGIQFASDRLERMVKRLTEQRALVGGYARQADDEVQRVEDRRVLDVTVRSTLRDVDFAGASARFALLQTQLQAGLQVASRATQLSLLDFLG